MQYILRMLYLSLGTVTIDYATAVRVKCCQKCYFIYTENWQSSVRFMTYLRSNKKHKSNLKAFRPNVQVRVKLLQVDIPFLCIFSAVASW